MFIHCRQGNILAATWQSKPYCCYLFFFPQKKPSNYIFDFLFVCFSLQGVDSAFVPTVHDFDKKLTESDAYLQILIDQLKVSYGAFAVLWVWLSVWISRSAWKEAQQGEKAMFYASHVFWWIWEAEASSGWAEWELEETYLYNMSSLMLEFSLSCYLRMLHEVLTTSEINIFTRIRKWKVLIG